MRPSSSRTPAPDSSVLWASETAKVSRLASSLPNSEVTGADRANMDASRRDRAQSGWVPLLKCAVGVQAPSTLCEGTAHLTENFGGGSAFSLLSVSVTTLSSGAG